jgi:hypothetical protein
MVPKIHGMFSQEEALDAARKLLATIVSYSSTGMLEFGKWKMEVGSWQVGNFELCTA